jgi:hypothetical protein
LNLFHREKDAAQKMEDPRSIIIIVVEAERTGWPGFMIMKGEWPSADGRQGQSANHLMLLVRETLPVVSDKEKRGQRTL